MNTFHKQIGIIRALFEEAESQSIPLWLESGWAIDARLGHVTRKHEDIDMAFPSDQRPEYIRILNHMGFGNYEELDYGFLMSNEYILIDSEPCFPSNGSFTLTNFPDGSCPIEKEGKLEGFHVRCLSWEAMYFEFLGYMNEIPMDRWQPIHRKSLKIIEDHLTVVQKASLKKLFGQQKT